MDMHLEDNKYYQPDLSEFHIGFEYEFKHPDEGVWREYILKEVNPEREDCPFAYQGYEMKDFRVKHLNRGDIEDLGFKFLGTQNAEFKNYYDLFELRNKHLHLNTSGLCFSGNIKINNGEKYEAYNYYVGYIKNKSELKRLLNSFET